MNIKSKIKVLLTLYKYNIRSTTCVLCNSYSSALYENCFYKSVGSPTHVDMRTVVQFISFMESRGTEPTIIRFLNATK